MVDDAKRHAKATDQRATEMYRLRAEGRLTFRAVSEQFGVSTERARQIIRLYCHAKTLPFPGGRVTPD